MGKGETVGLSFAVYPSVAGYCRRAILFEDGNRNQHAIAQDQQDGGQGEGEETVGGRDSQQQIADDYGGQSRCEDRPVLPGKGKILLL